MIWDASIYAWENNHPGKESAVGLTENAERKITAVILSIDGIELGFADGSSGMIPFGEIPEIEHRAAVRKVGLPNPDELVVEIADGGNVEISLGLCPTLLR